MQLMNTRSDIKTNMPSNRVEFGISKDSAKLFSMLSSSLYSNKEQAVMYEIGANCNDAHILAGTPDRPWDLTMPTSLDSHIRFRDYGPGLSENDVYLLLTTYGESTKSDSNTFIGAFGLGSKSPAAVTSTWNVVSRFAGKLKEYFIVVDASGIPSLSKIREEDIDVADTGLEVIIPVNPSRIWNWTDNVSSVYNHYTVKPNVKNCNVKWNEPAAKIQSGIGWYMTKSADHYSRSAKISFVTTQRSYAIDEKLLQGEFKSAKFLLLLNLGIVVDFPVGELETSLSREQIQYTKHTLSSIKMRLTMVYDEFMTKLNTHLDAATDGLHYRQLVVSGCKTLFGSSNHNLILPFIAGNKYGVAADRDLSYFSAMVDDVTKLECKIGFSGKVAKLTNRSSCWKSYAISLLSEYRTTKGGVQLKISYLDKLWIVLDDAKSTPARVKFSLPHGHYALIVKTNFLPPELQRFIVKASSLDMPPKLEARKKSVLWALWKNSFVRLDESSIDKTKTIVAIEFADARTKESISDFQKNALSIVKDSHMNHVTIIAVKEGTKIPSYAVSIEDFILAEFARLNTVKFVEDKMYAELRNQLVGFSYSDVLRLVMRMKWKTSKSSVWNEVVASLEEIESVTATPNIHNNILSEYYTLTRISELLDIPLKTSKGDVISFDKIREKLYNSYNMLKYVDSTSDRGDVIRYIELVGI